MRRAARTDATHAAIVKALRQVGCKVSDTSRIGGGFPDLVVRRDCIGVAVIGHRLWYDSSRILLMEVKTPKGKLTPEQEAFIKDWPETVIVRSVEEALKAVGIG